MLKFTDYLVDITPSHTATDHYSQRKYDIITISMPKWLAWMEWQLDQDLTGADEDTLRRLTDHVPSDQMYYAIPADEVGRTFPWGAGRTAGEAVLACP